MTANACFAQARWASESAGKPSQRVRTSPCCTSTRAPSSEPRLSAISETVATAVTAQRASATHRSRIVRGRLIGRKPSPPRVWMDTAHRDRGTHHHPGTPSSSDYPRPLELTPLPLEAGHSPATADTPASVRRLRLHD
jgi:hypothetical protein